MPHQGYYEFIPKSIDVCSDGKIIVSSEKSVVLTDTNGTSFHEIQIEVQGAIQSVYSISPESFLITTQNLIYKVDKSFSTIDSVLFAGKIKKTLLSDNKIYALFNSELLQLDTSLNIIDTLISSKEELSGFEIYGNKIWVSRQNINSILLTQITDNMNVDSISLPKLVNETEFIVTEKSFVFTGNSLSNQIVLYSFSSTGIVQLPVHLPDIELVDFDISKITIEYHLFQGDSIATGYFFTPELTVKNSGSSTLQSLAVYADLHGGFNCAQNFFYQKITGLEILPGQSKTVSLSRGYEEDIKNNELCFRLLAPNGEIETEIENNSICKTFTITATDKYKKPEITVYPNPCVDFLVIKNPSVEPLAAEIIDLNGKVLIQEHTGFQIKTIDTRCLKPGFYILKITSDSAISTQTIIKQ